MSRILLFTALLVLINFDAVAEKHRQFLLDENFKIYLPKDEGLVVSWPAPDTTAKILPTINKYKGQDGCYITCYSRNPSNAVYGIQNNFVMGQVRVEGRYVGTSCIPGGFEGKNISTEHEFSSLCETSFPENCVNSSCWAGNDTGRWFGL